MRIFDSANMVCKQAKKDADTLIIKIYFNVILNHDNVRVLGENVDLMLSFALLPMFNFLNKESEHSP